MARIYRLFALFHSCTPKVRVLYRVAEPPDFRRLRLLVNCKAEIYEFVTTKKNYFLPDTKLQNLHVPKVEHVNSVILYHGRKYFFLVVTNSQFSALQFTRSRSRSRIFLIFSAPAPAPAKKAGSGRLRLRKSGC